MWLFGYQNVAFTHYFDPEMWLLDTKMWLL